MSLRPNTIYFVRMNEFVKIGITSQMTGRMAHYKGLPYEVFLVRTIKNASYAQEEWLHSKYENLRVRKTEWFMFVEDMLTIEVPNITVFFEHEIELT